MAASDLIEAAVRARMNAHAPYSKFFVGAAVRDAEGRVHAGCNVENAAYPQGLCAEASALAAMVLAGGRRCIEAAIVGAGEEPCTPCGGCRQKLREFASSDLPIHVCDEAGKLRRTFTLAELLPHSFGSQNLRPVEDR